MRQVKQSENESIEEGASGVAPLFYGLEHSEVHPLYRGITSNRVRGHLLNALRQIDWALESAGHSDGNHLGEYLQDIHAIKSSLRCALSGRRVAGSVMVRHSSGWIRRYVPTPKNVKVM